MHGRHSCLHLCTLAYVRLHCKPGGAASPEKQLQHPCDFMLYHGSAGAGLCVASCASQSAQLDGPKGGMGRRMPGVGPGGVQGPGERLVAGLGVVVVERRRFISMQGRDAGLIVQRRAEWLGSTLARAPPFPGRPKQQAAESSKALNWRGERQVLDVWQATVLCAWPEQQTDMVRACVAGHTQRCRSPNAAAPPQQLPPHRSDQVLRCCAAMRAVLQQPRPPHSSFLSELLSAGLAGVWRGILAITCKW